MSASRLTLEQFIACVGAWLASKPNVGKDPKPKLRRINGLRTGPGCKMAGWVRQGKGRGDKRLGIAATLRMAMVLQVTAADLARAGEPEPVKLKSQTRDAC